MVPVRVNIYLKALAGFTQAIETEIVNQVINYLVTLPIGYDSYISKLIAATQLPEPDGLTYDVTLVQQSRDGAPPSSADVSISFIEAAMCEADLITVTVS
jgi:hypothetical protein